MGLAIALMYATTLGPCNCVCVDDVQRLECASFDHIRQYLPQCPPDQCFAPIRVEDAERPRGRDCRFARVKSPTGDFTGALICQHQPTDGG